MTADLYELSAEEIDLVNGGLGIGAVSSDAVFGAGVGLGTAAVAMAATGVGVPVAVGMAFVGGVLIGWSVVTPKKN
jgi:hypothetical protein